MNESNPVPPAVPPVIPAAADARQLGNDPAERVAIPNVVAAIDALDTGVRGTGAVASIPLTVAGTLDSPLVYPSTAALLGGAAGTVLLPGVGTAAGVKVGGMVEKLFGKK